VINLNFFNNLTVPADASQEKEVHTSILKNMGYAMSIGGLIWGTICLFYGFYLQSLIPYGYAFFTCINFWALAKWDHFPVARDFQLSLSLLLPFAFQFVIGGYEASGCVILWGLVPLIAALNFIKPKKAFLWLAIFIVLVLLAAVFDDKAIIAYDLDKKISRIFFAVNISIITLIVYTISYKFIGNLNEAIADFREAKQQADLANKAKSQFLANMSHEIRTPLNGVVGFTELLMLSNLNETQQEYVSTIAQSADSLLDIINDILDFSKIEAGKLELNIDKLDLYDAASQVVDMIKYQAHSKKLEVLIDIKPDVPRYIWADEMRIKQILVNLLSNAVKFTEHGEIALEIKVSYTQHTKADILFKIRDTGIGIEEQNHKKIFKAFTQEDNSTTKRFGGTGLGLTISNRLLEFMNSSLQLKSTAGKGSEFSFEISCPYENGELVAWDDSFKFSKILVVDDNTSNRRILQEMLLIRNIESDTAASGVQALELLDQNNKYDVIIMDYHMPVLNGIDTIRKIREKNAEARKQPVILLYSSADDDGIAKACRELQVQQQLVKPLKIKTLYHSLALLKRTQRFSIQPANDTKVASTSDSKIFKILIAEDYVVNMTLARIILKKLYPNSEVTEATTGLEAVSKFEECNPDLVLMDIQMPEMNGYDATRAIRKMQTDRRVPIIALTAGTVKGEKEKCFAVDMDDFISKPFNIQTMKDAVNRWIN
jgi:signal transduction histidine kinase/DNA-binding response OmpR family regulator